MATIRRFDDLGRIVIPKVLREQAWGTSNTEGMQMDIIIQDDAVVIKKHRKSDFVEVVRCLECVHCDPENRHCDHPMGTTLPIGRKETDFCSYGKKVE